MMTLQCYYVVKSITYTKPLSSLACMTCGINLLQVGSSLQAVANISGVP